MRIVEVCIKRPVFTTMMMCAIVVLGAFSFPKLGIDLFPNIDFPFILIQTTLKGAGPEEVETSISKPIEEAVNTIAGIEELNSTSFEGFSQIFIKFALDKNIDVAAQDVRDKISGITRNLPQGTDPPVVAKFDMGSFPVMSIAVSGDMGLVELTRVAKKKIKENIETVSGVGAVDVAGGREREVHIVINPLKLAALGIPIKEVKDAIVQQNIEIPGGRVEELNKEYVLRTLGRIGSVDDFSRIVVGTRNGVPVRVSDIGRVEDTGQDVRSIAFLNGRPCVSLVVRKQSGTNTVAVSDGVKSKLAELKPILPAGVQTKILGDQSEFVKDSVRTVEEHLVLGALLAALMVLVFMGDWRATIVAALAIPTSIVGTFVFMDLAGFTLNNMTLLALTIAVGLVIDDAIVVLENAFRHMDHLKKPPAQAALDGTTEIGLAVMATTLSLLVIFVPLAYMSGIVGRFISSYGFTTAYAIAISLFVAFTLTPTACAVFLKPGHAKTRLHEAADAINERLVRWYTAALEWALARRKTMVAVSAVVMLSSVPLIMLIGKDFLPKDDTSKFNINVKAPEGTSIPAMKRLTEQIETDIRRLPYVQDVLSSVGQSEGHEIRGTNEAAFLVEIEDSSRRAVHQDEVIGTARRMLAKYTSLKTMVAPVGGFGGGKESELMFVIAGPDLNKLKAYADAVAESIKKEDGIVDVDTSFSYAKPEFRVVINRDRAHDLGVKVEDIAMSMRTMVGGEEDITKYKDVDELYQVRLRADHAFRNRVETISALMVPAGPGRTARLDSVATVEPGFGPTQIDRFSRQRQISVLANLAGKPIGYAIEKAQAAFDKLGAPPDYRTDLVGKAKELGHMLRGFLMAFTLSFVFIYMVLASQFESFVHPVTIMVALPLTIPFALLSLFMVGENLGIFTIMGVFMLVGIVKKNAILQVDYTNTLRARGLPRHQAIIEANQTRLRPILMTTFTLIAGMLPVALGQGAGSGTRRSMAVVIIGGQLMSLLITLVMTPVTYSLLDDLQEWLRRQGFGFGGRPGPRPTEPNP
ncbi:MAG: efflux RND transporter permease subunit [Elusimicrobia bacterium]|nr:efflux RND transporter permease subunit [Elusimicrobiota bacterium]